MLGPVARGFPPHAGPVRRLRDRRGVPGAFCDAVPGEPQRHPLEADGQVVLAVPVGKRGGRLFAGAAPVELDPQTSLRPARVEAPETAPRPVQHPVLAHRRGDIGVPDDLEVARLELAFGGGRAEGPSSEAPYPRWVGASVSSSAGSWGSADSTTISSVSSSSTTERSSTVRRRHVCLRSPLVTTSPAATVPRWTASPSGPWLRVGSSVHLGLSRCRLVFVSRLRSRSQVRPR
jgi:hypothetical protein